MAGHTRPSREPPCQPTLRPSRSKLRYRLHGPAGFPFGAFAYFLQLLDSTPIFPAGDLVQHLEDVEFATLEWVDWFNTRRLLEPIGYVPPAEYEAAYHQQQSKPPAELALT